MNITPDIVNDLLPLYASGDCSDDTKILVEEYLRSHPDLAQQLDRIAHQPMTQAVPTQLDKRVEMNALVAARRRIKRRSYLMAAAIFFTLAPFAFVYTGGKFYWVISESPASAVIYLLLAAAFWAGYAIMKSKSRDL